MGVENGIDLFRCILEMVTSGLLAHDRKRWRCFRWNRITNSKKKCIYDIPGFSIIDRETAEGNKPVHNKIRLI
ncbi:hypothetical protein J2T58_002101 [Methanocalculus alkaliphilus]|nr:hypothetical protein [Methanocalculus alkaliphilus]